MRRALAIATAVITWMVSQTGTPSLAGADYTAHLKAWDADKAMLQSSPYCYIAR